MKQNCWLSVLAPLLTVSALTGCLGGGGDDGFTASDGSRVGDGIPSTAAQRGSLEYGGPDGCSDGTRVVLNLELGAPILQIVCGVAATDTAGNPIHSYKGIPYADTTAYPNRWVDPKPSREPFVRAVEYGLRCPQGKAADFDPRQSGEDCLYLNIWTPKVARDDKADLPVMVFIHGGAFISGSGGSAEGDASGNLNLYDGRQFLATAHALGQDIVFVTLNYRLGALGFLSGSGLGLDGNFGIKDQTRALEWVRRNIALFGGDPGRVMIFGESAGAQSTALHLTIQANDHQALFQKAVLESNYGMSYETVEEAQQKANAFAKATGCKDQTDPLACLRKLGVTAILDKQLFNSYSLDNVACAGMQAFLPWNPVIDHHFIVQSPLQGAIAKPVMNGSNRSESIPFLALLPDADSAVRPVYVALMGFLFGADKAVEIVSTYDLAHADMNTKQRMEQVVTDYMWSCFNRRFSRAARQTSADNPVYRYHNMHHGSFSIWTSPAAVAQACSASPNVCHADELPFVFGNATNSLYAPQVFTADEASLSLALRQYWVQFAVGSGPNAAALPVAWPLDASGKYLEFQAPASASRARLGDDLALPAFCDYWDKVGYEKTQSVFHCDSF